MAAGSTASAQAAASSRAADDESPEARGNDEARTPRRPRVGMPASASAHAVPATYAAIPPGLGPIASRSKEARSPVVSLTSSTRRSSAGAKAIRISRSTADGRTNPRL